MKKVSHADDEKKKLEKIPTRTRLIVGIILYIFGALAFYGSQLLSPLHVPIAFFFLYRAYKKSRALYELVYTKKVHTIAKRTWKRVLLHKTALVVCAILFVVWYTYISLIPTDKAVFSDLSHADMQTQVDTDLLLSAQYIDMLTVTGEALLGNAALYKAQPTPVEQEALRQDWDAFLGVAMASEEVTEVYRYFPQIGVFAERDLHAQSFTISYALYMKKFEYFHKIIAAVGTHENIRMILNEYSKAFGARNSYTDVTDRYFAANSLLRRNVGYAYHLLINPAPEAVHSDEYAILLRVADDSYHYLFKNIFSHILHRGITYTHELNEGVADSWLPIQKTVFVDTIGNVHVGNRTEKFITLSDIETIKKALLPGDIFLARKNWYASNVGIPGFWTHAGLYTGTLVEMELYFGEIFPYEHRGVTYASLSELLTRAYPEAYAAYTEPDTYGHTPSVIESETKGTNIQSIEHSAHVDYFGVMRTSLSKKDMLESLLRVFMHKGKPYDYEFSMLTKDSIFCSELVYDAYVPLTAKEGVVFPTSVVTGREIVSPNDIMKKFASEYGTEEQELSFVYFLDGNEVTGTAQPADVKTFIESYARPKYSFLQE